MEERLEAKRQRDEVQAQLVEMSRLQREALDGFRALSEWLPQEWKEFGWRHANIFMFALFALFLIQAGIFFHLNQ